ncbi:MAG: serine/threonine-protein kinase [Polyangiaceae bacterium]
MSAATLAEGTIIGERFRVGKLIGDGSFGSVYEANDEKTSARIALKILHSRLASDKSVRARFEREAKALSLLESPRICPLIEWGVSTIDKTGTPIMFMALPFIEGCTLAELLEKSPTLEESRVLHIAAGICEGVAAAHAAGILHRDLNPDNVLVGEGDSVHVLDFGLAKIVYEETSSAVSEVTASGMIFGTPEYMAPEQARGDELDGRTDVYAAGALMYRMATGAPPFHAATLLGTLQAVLVDPLVPPRERNPAVSEALEAVILHALSTYPESRYASANALGQAIARVPLFPNTPSKFTPDLFSNAATQVDAIAKTMPQMPALSSKPAPVLEGSVPVVTPPPSKPTPRERESVRRMDPKVEKAKPPRSDTWIWILLALIAMAAGSYLAFRYA